MVDNLILSVLSWGTFFFIMTYLAVAYYITPKRPCWIFAFYFLLAYVFEMLFLYLMLFVVNKIIGREGDPRDWDLQWFNVVIIIACLYAVSLIARYILYDRKHLKKA